MQFYDHLDNPRLQAIDADRLAPFVRQALDKDDATVTDFTSTRLKGIGGGVGGNQVMLFRGGSSAGPWALVLKILQPQAIDRLDGPHYWLREVEVYRSGFADALTGPLKAPRCFAVEQNEDCWLWLEFVEENVPHRWPPERFVQAAEHLGHFNAAMRDAKTHPWMSADWHRDNLQQVAPLFSRFVGAKDHPLYTRGFPGDSHDYISGLWDDRTRFLDALAHIPWSICHYDAFRRNLLARADDTVAIDWTFVGPGPLGSDAAALGWVSIVFNDYGPEDAAAVYDDLFDAYLRGLKSGGWHGDDTQIRLGYAATWPVRVLISAGYDTLLFLDEGRHPFFEDLVGMSMTDYMRHQIAPAQRLIRRACEEARSLMG